MIKVGIISDVHADNYGQCSEMSENGYNERLLDAMRVLIRWGYHMKKEGAEIGILMGDITHHQGWTPHAVYNILDVTFAKLHTMGIKLVAFPGNHDYDEFCKHHSLSPWDDMIKVISRPEVLTYGGLKLGFIPYQPDADSTRHALKGTAGADFVFGHLAIRGGHLGTGYIWGREIELRELDGDKVYFSGHCHVPSKLGEKPFFHYNGAPQQLTWGDEGNPTQLSVLSLNRGRSYEFHTARTATPEFKTIALDDLQARAKEVRGNFVKLVVPTSYDRKKLKEILAHVDHVLKPRWLGHVEVPETINESILRKHSLKSVGSAVIEYVRTRAKSGRRTLAKSGLSYLKRAAEEIDEQ